MNNYRYNKWNLCRNDKVITITDENCKLLYRLELTQKKNIIGKINIPLSNICTMQCLYCSEAQYNNNNSNLTSYKVACSIIDAYFNYVYEKEEIKYIYLSFDYGGEPVCRIEVITKLSAYFRKKCVQYNKQGIVQMTTNGVWDTSLAYLIMKSVDEIIISIDGYQELHDKYRKYKSGKSKFNLIFNNAQIIYKSGKLKQLSSVITLDTVINVNRYIDFLVTNFKGISIKMNAVIITGDAKKNSIKRVSYTEWEKFITRARSIAGNNLIILDSKPEKDISLYYQYGCDHMQMNNWFYWLNGKITCCTDRNTEQYVIGTVLENNVNLNVELMERLKTNNHIENIDKCADCFAKYYCAGGCPRFRDEKINCNRRIEKYAKLLIEKAGIRDF